MLRARSHPYRQSIRVLPRPRLVFSSEPRQRGPILKAVHARGVAYEVVRRVFEEDAYADRAFRSQAEGLDERDRAFAMQLAYGTVQRVRALDYAIETLGRRPVRKLDPPVRTALRLGAYQLAYLESVPRARGGQRKRRARPGGPPRARGGVHERCHAAAGGRHRPASLGASGVDAAGGGARALLPGLGGGNVVARMGRGCRAGAHAGTERAAGAGSARARRRPDRFVAAEPRLAARRRGGGRAARRARPRPLRGSGREGHAARRRGRRRRRRREEFGPRSRAGGKRSIARRQADGRERRRARALSRAHGLRPRSRGCTLLRPRRAQLPGPTFGGAPVPFPSSSSTC